MKFKLLLLILILSINNIFAVTVIDPNTQIIPTEPTKTFADNVISGLVLGLGFGLGGAVIYLIVQWIAKKFRDAKRSHKDLIYYKFLHEVNLANINRDSHHKYRDWKWFFLAWKRTRVYVRNSEELKLVGFYDGELNKKEGFKLISLYSKKNFFTGENYLLILPYNIKSIFKKETYENKSIIVIECEGLDEVGNTDYYLMPIIKDLNGDINQPFLDFNDFVHEQYFDKYVLREVIKDTMIRGTQAVEKATELNPYIQTERKNPKQ